MIEGISTNKNDKKVPLSRLPLLRPDNIIEQLFYYPPSIAEADVATRTSQAVLDHWNNQTKYIPKDISVQHVIQYGKKDNLEVQLTPSGLSHVEDLIECSRRSHPLAPLK